jgi:purine-cytosine permease-like protein
VLGAVMGMSQAWFVGPIAILIGEPPFGGDIGFELAFSFAATTYLIFRTIELRIAGR